jgi:hypothetical protein
LNIEVGIYPSIYRFDSDFFGADYAPGLDSRLSIKIREGVYFENLIGFYIADTDCSRLEGIKDRINIRINLIEDLPVIPEFTAGVALISANPIAETVTGGFRPSQTAFYLSAGAGASMNYSDSIVLRGEINILATPYRYRILSYDRESIDEHERQFTQVSFALGASYRF